MSENDSWAPPSADGSSAPPPPAPETAPAPAPAPAAQYAPPPPQQYAQPQPQYGQYPPQAPPPPQYGQYAPPSPQYGQYAPPPPPQYGQYAPPPPPQYGQYAPPPAPPGYPQPGASVPYWAQGQGYAQPGPAQWAPPPKPGLIPLRPLGFGTLMGAPFQVLRRNPKATFGSGLIVQLAIILVTVLFVGGAVFWAISRSVSANSADQAAVGAGSTAIVLLSLLVPVALTLFASALLQAVLVVEVARGTLGEKRRLGELWKAAFRRILPLTGWYALLAAAIVVVLGLIVLAIVAVASLGDTGVVFAVLAGLFLGLGSVVLAVWLGTKLSMVPCIIVLERIGVFASMRRSWKLTTGNFWRTFGVIALVYVILSTASQLLSVPFQFLMPIALSLIDPNNTGSGIVGAAALYLVFLAFSIVLSAVTSVVQAATVAVIYIDLRMRTEGLDIELARFVESRQIGDDSWPDPYLPQRRG
ncbi:hypothetical protein N1027_00315 [Herbiconiux sp. CPCC 205763]|uniref:DUF7847 domain-containing protein n=1 Tax=Herbiconiux aconitum TaxID=2970913 RepID=A0ABT2GK30_9MICO|nr:hypothetical protein [Herbiconiux aconitum]MCS5716575.1 hypothetical protein [Herbiconiux aconitum]